MYPDAGDAAHYYGCITELDEQVGRIRATIEELGVADNTLIFFCSDNGPEGRTGTEGRRRGVTDGLRGRKRDLYDGGVRVPAFAVWPGKIQAETKNDSVLTTLDYFPTIARVVGYHMPDRRPIDGEDVLDILTGRSKARTKSIPFRYNEKQSSLVKGGYKLLLPAYELYDLSHDRPERKNLAAAMPEKARAMKAELVTFFESVKNSHSGSDYNDPSFKAVDPWQPLKIK